MKKLIFSISLILLSVSSYGVPFDGSAKGKLGLVEVSGELPYSFMVRLTDGGAAMCGANTTKWAYVSHDDPNYSAFISVLLATKLADKTVDIYSRNVIGDKCKIVHLGFE